MRNYITELVSNNLDTKQPDKLASKLYLLFEGALVESYLQQDSWPIKDAKEIAMQLI